MKKRNETDLSVIKTKCKKHPERAAVSEKHQLCHECYEARKKYNREYAQKRIEKNAYKKSIKNPFCDNHPKKPAVSFNNNRNWHCEDCHQKFNQQMKHKLQTQRVKYQSLKKISNPKCINHPSIEAVKFNQNKQWHCEVCNNNFQIQYNSIKERMYSHYQKLRELINNRETDCQNPKCKSKGKHKIGAKIWATKVFCNACYKVKKDISDEKALKKGITKEIKYLKTKTWLSKRRIKMKKEMYQIACAFAPNPNFTADLIIENVVREHIFKTLNSWVGLEFMNEKSLSTTNGKHKQIDLYLPEFNLFIEYKNTTITQSYGDFKEEILSHLVWIQNHQFYKNAKLISISTNGSMCDYNILQFIEILARYYDLNALATTGKTSIEYKDKANKLWKELRRIHSEIGHLMTTNKWLDLTTDNLLEYLSSFPPVKQ